MTMKIRIMITGGGTGGHAMPAIATIKAIKELAESDSQNAETEWAPEFLYVGSENGVEKRLAEEMGVEFRAIKTGKLRRASNPLKMINAANIKDMFRAPAGFFEAIGIVKNFAPDALLSTGGYVSVPASLAASLLGVPVIAHEQTVQIGLANKMIMARAAQIALSFPESADELPPRLKKVAVTTGNPVREAIFHGDPQTAQAWAGFDSADSSLPTVYVTGGAQGSRMINIAFKDCLDELLKYCRIIHQCGKQPGDSQDIDALKTEAFSLPKELARRYFVTEFVRDEIADVFALADLVVGRSGAGTVTEVCALGKASLFIPLVPTGGDEQRRNANRLVKIGAARTIEQSELNGTTLLSAVKELVSDPALLIRMGESAKTLARPNASSDLARLVKDAAKKGEDRTCAAS